ncbi:hypothetical protein COY16_03690 [Candidatus Roizmanbacteria bacterium CG_4_10_14_0_2_um_filter_39_13]|uniref:HTH cro/C1-type domain-containing protein n=1 Tax=Candidatus Roizmanbacteria bacterium CG_4_10_14_0_2_um_filter_39_13 TaxID=1974825 RepID=A0A2M7TXR1_9BACT|nr:MAG: hypothetical protein COY16_03690 [Candidatus Roizmanbacteria bacterium CG_4_10_14_0_2_um_filter_39_13]
MSASLGGLLKDYRLQKNVSQMEIAFALGWKDTARISRIEQGHIEKPDRILIDKICKALELKSQETNRLLFIGGYLPTINEIKHVKSVTNTLIQSWKYPAAIRDFSWRIIHSNEKIFQYYKVDQKQKNYIINNYPSVIEVTFHSEFILNKEFMRNKFFALKRKIFLTTMLKDFKEHQRNRTKDRWYIDFIKKMLGNPLFREIWTQTDNVVDPLLDHVTNFAIKTAFHPNNPNIILTTYLMVTPYREDPRFEIEFYTPANMETFKYFNSLK